jgi:fermentation-respiration switch protein FrsA (DUF1100 family)
MNYSRASEPKELFIVPGAGHVDLYDRVNVIPWDKLQSFFGTHLAGAKAPWSWVATPGRVSR